MRALLLFVLALASCSTTAFEEDKTQRSAVAPEQSRSEREEVPVKEGRALLGDDTPAELEPKAVEVDPYADWNTWCEPSVAVCTTAKDCEGLHHPSAKPLKCVRPWYATSDEYRVCSPGWSNRQERAHQRARIRELVRLQYSGEDQCEGACYGPKSRGDRLARLLNIVAQRETTMRRWKRHRLNGDIRANQLAWTNQAKQYGHDQLLETRKGRRYQRPVGVDFVKGGNPHYKARWRWEFGLGLYGMNAPLFTSTWDAHAPPEVLCLEVPATEVYLRTARRVLRKLSGGIDCDGDGVSEWRGTGGSPTIHDVHRGASGGKLCPGTKLGFDRRARKAGLDPYRKVTLSDLGTPIDPDAQIERAAELLSKLEQFSTAWMAESQTKG